MEKETLPPEEDTSIAVKNYAFNPVQARKEVRTGNYYFKADGSWSSIPSLDAIAVDATYLQVTIGKNSEVIACERVAKQRILRHSYSYRDNGTLSRLVFETESGSGMDDYDEAGRRRN